MASKMKQLLSILILGAIFSNSAIAQTIKTNIEGLVVKELRCNVLGHYSGNIVNRTSQSMQKTVLIKVFDSDGDPIGNCSSSINLGASSGDRIDARDCNCQTAKSVEIFAN